MWRWRRGGCVKKGGGGGSVHGANHQPGRGRGAGQALEAEGGAQTVGLILEPGALVMTSVEVDTGTTPLSCSLNPLATIPAPIRIRICSLPPPPPFNSLYRLIRQVTLRHETSSSSHTCALPVPAHSCAMHMDSPSNARRRGPRAIVESPDFRGHKQ